MNVLAPGANAPLASAQCQWNLVCGRANSFGESLAVALLPVNDKRQPQGQPVLLHNELPWLAWSGDPDKVACAMDLRKLPAGSDRALLVVYVYAAQRPLAEFKSLCLIVDDALEHRLNLDEHGESAIILGEFYRRQDAWKFRALAEGSAYGLAALGRRLGVTIDDAHPTRRTDTPAPRGESATGTAFAVGPQHVLTCAHVIEGMRTLQIASFEGKHSVEVVLADRRNDLALLRVLGAQPLQFVAFRDGVSCELGESVVALGFPMAGFAGGGVQVTQGGISGLFGLRDDASLLQFTAAIQPGSSGSPLFDDTGAVVGMVTSSVPDAQNMNFAVKSALALAFLDACRLSVNRERPRKTLTTTEIVREMQPALWRVEASNS